MELNASLGSSLSAAGCTGCGNVFTTARNFDRHQHWVDGKLTCRSPVSLGFERKTSGHWGRRATAAGMAQFAAAVRESDENETVSSLAA